MLKRFLVDLPNVRKALANISSYMMFDDHEVTDDWFLNRDWCVNILTETSAAPSLGRRILQNSLAAYTVFQAWGNTPDRFETGEPGRDILILLADLATDPAADWSDVGYLLLPALDQNQRELVRPTGALDWHYSIDFGSYVLAVLDTRNHRGFDDGWKAARLINQTHLPQQIPFAVTPDYLLVLSPAPVIGYLPVEKLLQFGSDTSDSVVNSVMGTEPSTAGLVQIPLHELVGRLPVNFPAKVGAYISIKLYQFMATEDERKRAEIKAHAGVQAELDFEAWGYHPEALEQLLEQLAQYPQVVILSGDVHYSFSNTIEYWNNRGTLDSYSVFTQLCSSAARNAAGLTESVDQYSAWSAGMSAIGSYVASGGSQFSLMQLPQFTFFGWQGSGTDWTGTDYIHPLAVVATPDWQYRIRFVADFRDPVARHFPPLPSFSSSPKTLAELQRYILWLGLGRVVVGHDNIGLVEFSRRANELYVCQDFLWSRVGDDPMTAPSCQAHSRHELLLKPAAAPPKLRQ